MTVYDYAKLGTAKKEEVLISDALFLEYYVDKGTIIYVYYLNGFFIEVTKLNGNVVDNIPFIRGYKINKKNLHAIEKRNALLSFAA
ncbi:MAG: hypothetical protein Q8L81_17360 [Bacteroidota bacterium]|nr:hypothetical protein [Bacteroidota bacterium]